MASQKQITANQLNALQGTGPSTLEGKAIVSQNATRHGILSEKVIDTEDDLEKFETFRNSILVQTQPVGGIEELLVDKIISSAWRLRRIMKIERDFFVGDIDLYSSSSAVRFMNYKNELGLLSRYESQIQRSLYKALGELKNHQAMRIGAVIISGDLLESD